MEHKTIPAVYGAIAAVQAALAKHGIAKARKNAQQGYAFRGIDDVYCAIAPLLAGVVCVAGYYIAEVIILWVGGDFASAAVAALAAIPFNCAQALTGGIAYILLAAALDRLQFKRWLTRFK